MEDELKNKKSEEEKSERHDDWLKKLDEVNVIPQSAKERVRKLEEQLFRLKKANEDNELSMARGYRRRRWTALEGEDSELKYPMSRRTQSRPETQYHVKMISRTTNTDDIPTREVSVNTEIDYRFEIQ